LFHMYWDILQQNLRQWIFEWDLNSRRKNERELNESFLKYVKWTKGKWDMLEKEKILTKKVGYSCRLGGTVSTTLVLQQTE
jgi:hypothetical protein